MKKRKTKKKIKSRIVPMRMSPEHEYEMHDRHDADVSDAGDGGMIGESRLIAEYLAKIINECDSMDLNEISLGSVISKGMSRGLAGQKDVTDVKAERENLAKRYGGEENIPENQKNRLDRIEKEQQAKNATQADPPPAETAPAETADDTQAPDRIGGVSNIGGIVPKTPGSMGPEQSTLPTEPTEDAYQTEPIQDQPATPGVEPAETEAEPSASVNTVPDMSGGVQNFGYEGQDPRKMYKPQSSAQFQTQGYDFNTDKYNFMRESSIVSLVDSILNEKPSNSYGDFSFGIQDRNEDAKTYIQAALFNAVNRKNK